MTARRALLRLGWEVVKVAATSAAGAAGTNLANRIIPPTPEPAPPRKKEKPRVRNRRPR